MRPVGSPEELERRVVERLHCGGRAKGSATSFASSASAARRFTVGAMLHCMVTAV